jgi:hypothetical protein
MTSAISSTLVPIDGSTLYRFKVYKDFSFDFSCSGSIIEYLSTKCNFDVSSVSMMRMHSSILFSGKKGIMDFVVEYFCVRYRDSRTFWILV